MKVSYISLAIIAILPYIAFAVIQVYSPINFNSTAKLESIDLNFHIQIVKYIETVERKQIFTDKIFEFLNETRSKMEPGICFTEVPTASLYPKIKNIPAGNASNPYFSEIQICCDGYVQNPHNYLKCDPICKDDCPYGICTAPNTCLCLPGSLKYDEDNCVAICPIGCRNGYCQQNGSCKCKPGYILEPLSKLLCTPYCSQKCNIGGTCVAPDTCQCAERYELSANRTCQPICKNCENGTCTTPGLCTCNSGYTRQGNVCQPICIGCENGNCISPGKCECNAGFKLNNYGGTCVPVCDPTCLGGFCKEPNVCDCYDGLIVNENNECVMNPRDK